GPDKREKKSLKDSKELIDVLHYVCILWKEGNQEKMKSELKKSGYGEGEALYKVAQAISETLPNNSSEKKMIEGFLAGRDKIMEDIREDEPQTKLV
ncbi:MAG: DNA methylase, partial [Methanobacterium sp.]|nr:DNA methylase [Methanobacterium sp.]